MALRLSPENKEGIASPNSFVSVDDRRKQILLNDTRHLNPSSPHDVTTPPAAAAPPKMFAFDHVFAEDAAQVNLCLIASVSSLPSILLYIFSKNNINLNLLQFLAVIESPNYLNRIFKSYRNLLNLIH